MLKSLWIKFLILLLGVSVIALSAALLLRELMVRDFREYLQGEYEDRVHWVTADLEGTYEKFSGWNEEVIAEDAIWALMLGLEMRIRDGAGSVVMDTARAVGALSPSMKGKIAAVSAFRSAEGTGEFIHYPLFLKGREIGVLEARFLRPEREAVFIERSDRFLIASLFGLGGVALLLSLVFSKKLTNPVQRLTLAAEGISKGNLKGRVPVSGHDEISRLTAIFNRMSQTLETQESLRKKLISNIAHELRTPLGAIRSELEGMIDDVIPADKNQLQSLYEETGRLARILDGVDELTRAQASVLSLEKEPVSLRPFLRQIMDRFGKLFLDKGIKAELRCDEGLTFQADPDRLSQVVVNLLSNALKATGEAGKIWIAAGVRGPEAFLEVGDTGRGIRSEDLPFVFERFYRGSEGGLGLGLAISKELVEAHGGRVEAASEYGKGTVLTVYLPLSGLHNSS